MCLRMSPEIKCDDLILKFDLGEPSKYAKEKAKDELRETSENIEQGLKALKALLKDDPKLILPLEDKEWLQIFLRRCKYYPESAYKLINRYFNFRQKYSEVKELLNPGKLKHVFDHNQVSIMPQRDQFGRRIITMIAGEKWNHKLVHRDDCFRAAVLCCEALQLEPESQINGIVLILDCKGTTIGQSLEMTPAFMKRLVDYVQYAIPLRIKGFHFINTPSLCKPLFKVAKQFLTPNSHSRLIVHDSNLKSLQRYIAPECLPISYGGTLNCEIAYGRQTYELLMHFEEFFEKCQKYGYVQG
ncbi:retinaldehyde-binding protein 1-like [Calliphora vicina]|uniref:retinaldehyde-binding protein 1-like n=1 Tax=Calliphora vicina TaxID=7373 RepID=UPI00325AD05B